MEYMLVLCGIWILFLPLQKWNCILNYTNKGIKIIAGMCSCIGIFSTIVGLTFVLGVSNDLEKILIILYSLFVMMALIFIYRKIKVEKSVISKIAIVFSIVLLLISFVMAFLNVKEIASSCVIVTGIFTILCAPYDAIEKK